MAEDIADLVPTELLDVEYTRVNVGQVASIRLAMQSPDNQVSFQVDLLPVDSPEQRLAAAEEWAAHELAARQIKMRERGAIAIFGGRDKSPEALLALLEDRDEVAPIPGLAPFVTHSLLKVVKLQPGANTFDLLRGYFEDPKEHSEA